MSRILAVFQISDESAVVVFFGQFPTGTILSISLSDGVGRMNEAFLHRVVKTLMLLLFPCYNLIIIIIINIYIYIKKKKKKYWKLKVLLPP